MQKRLGSVEVPEMSSSCARDGHSLATGPVECKFKLRASYVARINCAGEDASESLKYIGK